MYYYQETFLTYNQMTDFYYINTILEQFFKDRYPHDTDQTDYVQLLRSMNDDNSIKGLVKKNDKLLDKILSLQYYTIPDDWYRYDYLPDDNSSLLKELEFFLNKQIERVFNSCNEITEEMELQCLINLRPAMNREGIIRNIIPKCSESVRNEYEDIKTSIKYKEEAPEYLTPYNIGTNGYKANLRPYIQTMKKLIKIGYVKDLRDCTFEKRANINYLPNTSSKIKAIVSVIVIIPIAFLLIFAIGKVVAIVLCLLASLSFVRKGR